MNRKETLRRRADGREAGISLVEMLVVLAILGLAAGLGVSAVHNLLPGRRLDAAADAVANELARLRTEALRTGGSTRLIFDAASERFVSSRPGAPAVPTGGLEVVVELPPESGAEAGEIRFLPAGGATGGRIVVGNGTESRVLRISRATGAIRRGEAVP